MNKKFWIIMISLISLLIILIIATIVIDIVKNYKEISLESRYGEDYKHYAFINQFNNNALSLMEWIKLEDPDEYFKIYICKVIVGVLIFLDIALVFPIIAIPMTYSWNNEDERSW